MGKKTKIGKGRLDKFYRIAKESGFRSRAAFKLIQLNRKYNFLENANVLVDLCAAPGGWLQVAEKYMPMNSIKIGVDLDPIKPIPHCKTFVMDITTEKCKNLIKKEIKGQKADVVLHDGAPNVGQNWEKDAFTQSELVLASFKLACQILRKGGTFVTKVFRSGDYNSLIWLFGKFFKKVEATKPEASRLVSAEIFVVCQHYLNPDYIDEKFFDLKYVFKDTENDLNVQSYLENEITSVDKLLSKRRHRDGYADDAPQHLYRTITFDQFIKCNNPFPIFMEYNKIELTAEDKEKYLSMKIKLPEDYDQLLEDIKLLGKREITTLIKWRQRIINENLKLQQKEKQKELQIEQGEKQQEEIGSEEELEQEIEKNQKLSLKQLRKEKEKKISQMAKVNGNLGNMEQQTNTVSLENADELFSFQAHRNLQQFGFVDVEEIEKEEKQKKIQKQQKQLKKYQFVNEEDIEKNVEHLYALKQKKKNIMKDKEQEAILKKRAKKIENRQADVDEDSLAIGGNALDELNQEQDQGESKYNKKSNGGIEVVPNPSVPKQDGLTKQKIAQKLQSKWFDREIFSELKQDLEQDIQKTQLGQNPLKDLTYQRGQNDDEEFSDDDDEESSDEEDSKRKSTGLSKQSKSIKKGNKLVQINKQVEAFNKKFGDDDDDEDQLEEQADLNEKDDESEEWDDEGAERYVPKVPLSEMEKRRKKLARARKREEKKQAQKNKENEVIEFVGGDKSDVDPSKKLDIEDLAANLALAKKMLRKKDREAIIESSYSRYALEEEDFENLPNWFLEDEKQHNFLSLPITKEEVQAEKERLYAINQRQPKKILEAKNRKKRRLIQKLKKAKKKAEQVYEQEGMTEKTKIRTISNLMKKARDSTKQSKKYVVGKKGKKGAGAKQNARGVKNVDNRMKKERRSKRRIEKRDGPKMNKNSKNIQKPKGRKMHKSRKNRK